MCVQADLLYMPFMERFALALPDLTASDLRPACEGIMKPWLEAMGQLACCQQAFPDSKLFQQALRCCLPIYSLTCLRGTILELLQCTPVLVRDYHPV